MVAMMRFLDSPNSTVGVARNDNAFVMTYGRKILKSPLEVELLLSYVLKRPREHFIAHPEMPVAPNAMKRFFALCKRRKKGVPLAYLTNYKEFFGLDFYVDEQVLIPRPETEMLVEEAILLAKSIRHPHILDVGTGSGCIAIALAKNLPNAKITALDISKDALAVARKNAKRHGVTRRIRFFQSDLLNLRFLDSVRSGRTALGMTIGPPFFDIIVANLPYIPKKESALVEKEVKKFEPPIALWGGNDGLFYFRKLFFQIKKLPQLPRFLICEFGFSMKKPLKALIKKHFPNAHTEFKKDLAGLNRMFISSFPRTRESMLDFT